MVFVKAHLHFCPQISASLLNSRPAIRPKGAFKKCRGHFLLEAGIHARYTHNTLLYNIGVDATLKIAYFSDIWGQN